MNNTKNNLIGKTIVGISLSLLVSLSGSMLVTPGAVHAAAAASTSTAASIIATGKQFLGVPYRFRAQEGRTDAFDCSSFTQYVFKQNGINLPRSSRQQAVVGRAVSKDQLQPGDLVFSDTNRDGVINHVSIYMGNGKLLHTYRVGIGVTISDFAGSAWDRTYVTARRVLADGQSVSTFSQTAGTDGQSQSSTQSSAQSSAQTGTQSSTQTNSGDRLQSRPQTGFAAPWGDDSRYYYF
ncbi:C40 family peptidase [Paenibacillus tuaregi]|uniref:C40 family peptidase n=1 Tax=Paenibacillus tuaregi TaxID=1816681 RepID=UPI000838A6F6|nr:C40 family peptidase [Paenibacillus tuaregi]